mgnify:CR=1 FL=1
MDEMNIFETAPSFPVIPLRGLVMFPDMVLHFDVGRKKSVAALKAAMNADQKIFWCPKRTQRWMNRGWMICSV